MDLIILTENGIVEILMNILNISLIFGGIVGILRLVFLKNRGRVLR
jgi:hypothetical protein